MPTLNTPFLKAVEYFTELVENTAHILRVDPQALIAAVSLRMMEDTASPFIEDVEWNARQEVR